ncbi:hypothetical protein FX987_02493 [Vreelandella titanicae]|uniref:Uncharacterized protein n=1 Tax=Vreelandella titanicae TaxID=664683 RepID=A0AAP9T1R0_9GAMM|nr:hypothetical protein FX987_02493 [Halomonas titanicae]
MVQGGKALWIKLKERLNKKKYNNDFLFKRFYFFKMINKFLGQYVK